MANHTVTLALAILFGTIIAVAVVLFSILLFCKQRYERQRKREHAFRYGEAIRHIQRQEELQRQQVMQQALLHPAATTPATLIVPEQYRSDDATEVTQLQLDKHMIGQSMSQSSDSVLPVDPFAREMMHVTGGPIAAATNAELDRDRDRPRPRSPWSMLSNAATTVPTIRSPSPQSFGTSTMLIGTANMNTASHNLRSADVHFAPPFTPGQSNLRTSSQVVEHPSQDNLIEESANSVSPLPVRMSSSLPINLLRRISNALPRQPTPPVVPLPSAPPVNAAPIRPIRPREGLLDWLNTGVADIHVFNRRRDRDDGNSSRTDFLKV